MVAKQFTVDKQKRCAIFIASFKDGCVVFFNPEIAKHILDFRTALICESAFE